MNDSGTSGQIVKRKCDCDYCTGHLTGTLGRCIGRLRTYAVKVDGYGEVHYEARSSAKARAKAYRAFCDAVGRWSFHTFLIMSRVWLVRHSALCDETGSCPTCPACLGPDYPQRGMR